MGIGDTGPPTQRGFFVELELCLRLSLCSNWTTEFSIFTLLDFFQFQCFSLGFLA